MSNSVDNLVRVVEIVGKAVPDDPVREWLDRGVQEFLQPGGPRLDDALGLRHDTNGRSPATQWLFQRRDELLRDAVEHCGGLNDFKRDLGVFERTIWPTCQRLTAPPKKWPALHRKFFDLLRVGVPIPRGRRRMQQIMARETSDATGCADALSLLSAQDQKKRRSR